MELISFLAAHGLEIIGGLVLIFSGALAISLVVPGEQPDKALQSIVDFLKKFSVK